MSHCGWRNVSLVGRPGDQGADIIAVRDSAGIPKTWVVQVKAVSGGNYVGISAVKEVLKAQSAYGADICAIATNGDFTDSVRKREEELAKTGFQLKRWNGMFLRKLLDSWPNYGFERKNPREYQQKIIDEAVKRFAKGEKRAQFIVATGLGKSLIAAEIANALIAAGISGVLVLCHTQDLAMQLEQSFWPQLPKHLPTRVFMQGEPPKVYDGINFGLFQSLIGYLPGIGKEAFDLVIVDEAHHALAHGFRSCLDHLSPKFLMGMTATPWRGDGRSIDELFGDPIARVSLIDGMAMGFLANVDYRLFCDNIDWKIIPKLTGKKLSIRDLNKLLFLPQRDEAAIDEIKRAVATVPSPRVAVFSPSIEHARRFAQALTASGIPCLPLSGEDRIARQRRIMDFAAGRLRAVTAVDLLNEGIDVPELNVLVFMRATHSRRIFVQQLGRGLRIAPHKDKVIVLDFVSDIRRLAEVVQLDREARSVGKEAQNVFLEKGVVAFSNNATLSFIEAWLRDATDLSEASDSEKLAFPGM